MKREYPNDATTGALIGPAPEIERELTDDDLARAGGAKREIIK